MLELVSSGAVAPLVFLAQKQDKSRFRWLDVLPQVELPRIQVQKSSDQFEPFSIEKLANSVGAAFLDARVAATFGNAVTRMDGELNDRLEQLFQGPERNYVERAVLEALSDVRDRSAAALHGDGASRIASDPAGRNLDLAQLLVVDACGQQGPGADPRGRRLHLRDGGARARAV